MGDSIADSLVVPAGRASAEEQHATVDRLARFLGLLPPSPGCRTLLCLLVSSSVPAAAGVQAPLVAELCRGGASVDGLDDDGLPLWTAVTFGYTSAVDQLVASGARVDNLIFAAVAGDIERMNADLAMNRDARAAARSSRSIGIHGPELAPHHHWSTPSSTPAVTAGAK